MTRRKDRVNIGIRHPVLRENLHQATAGQILADVRFRAQQNAVDVQCPVVRDAAVVGAGGAELAHRSVSAAVLGDRMSTLANRSP